MKMLILTHDLSCTFTELTRAVNRCTRASGSGGVNDLADLAVAAVALTIQLAIDAGDRDPGEMRALERELIDKLRAGLTWAP